jgi:hypothetical protein
MRQAGLDQLLVAELLERRLSLPRLSGAKPKPKRARVSGRMPRFSR